MNKILLIKAKSICYNSTWFFVDQYAQALNTLGCHVDVLSLTDNIVECLLSTINNHYDAIIDFNSILPKLTDKDNHPVLDMIGVPFYNYILDHPMYHHETLACKLKNYNVICLDANHQAYIQRYYSHIRKTYMLPLAGVKAKVIPHIANRSYGVTFTGTYTNSRKVLHTIDGFDPDYSQKMHRFAQQLITHPDMTLEELLLEACHNTPEPCQFALAMHTLFPVDMYVTAFYREKIIDTLVNCGIDVNVFGHGWEDYYMHSNSHFHYHGELEYSHSLDIIANSQVLLNVMPWFKAGIHDRVFNAMINGTIPVTDTSTYVAQNFTNKKDIGAFNLNDLGQCPDIICSIMSDSDLMQSISCNSINTAMAHHTYAIRSAQLLSFIC